MRLFSELWRQRQFAICKTGSVLFNISLTLTIAAVFLCPTLPVESDTRTDIPKAFMVNVTVDGSTWDYIASGSTVGEVLDQAGIFLGNKDLVYPSLGTAATPGMRIRVVRVVEKLITQREPINFQTVTNFDFSRTDEPKVLCKGAPGEKELKYAVVYKDGVKSGYKILEARIIKHPVKEVISVPRNISKTVLLASRSGRHTRSIQMIATAYDPGPRSCGAFADGITASGMRAGRGVVAVDPRVIRLGTKLYVEGYGLCVAGDTGGAIKGARIDLGYNTYSEAIRFGRKRVTVYILD